MAVEGGKSMGCLTGCFSSTSRQNPGTRCSGCFTDPVQTYQEELAGCSGCFSGSSTHIIAENGMLKTNIPHNIPYGKVLRHRVFGMLGMLGKFSLPSRIRRCGNHPYSREYVLLPEHSDIPCRS